MNKDAYIALLEKRIRNQRMQLSWWQKNFEAGKLMKKRFSWTSSQVNALLKRCGVTEIRANDDGRVTRRIKIARRQKS